MLEACARRPRDLNASELVSRVAIYNYLGQVSSIDMPTQPTQAVQRGEMDNACIYFTMPTLCKTHMTVRFGFQSLELNKLKQMSPLVYMCCEAKQPKMVEGASG